MTTHIISLDNLEYLKKNIKLAILSANYSVQKLKRKPHPLEYSPASDLNWLKSLKRQVHLSLKYKASLQIDTSDLELVEKWMLKERGQNNE